MPVDYPTGRASPRQSRAEQPGCTRGAPPMDTHDFRRLGHELIDWVADYRERIAEYPVMSRVEPGEVAAQLPAEPPRQAEGLATISADLERIVLPGVTHWNHPGWFAYFPSHTDLSSVLADLVSSGLGVQGMSWQLSLIHISEPTRLGMISYAVFCLKKKKNHVKLT